MPYILDAMSAGKLSAGEQEPQVDREIQRHLTAIEVAVRQAASKGLSKTPLLGDNFEGWDKNDIRSGPSCLPQVFDALLAAGYGFYTEKVLQATVEECGFKITYVHTVITWPKIVSVSLGPNNPEGLKVLGVETELFAKQKDVSRTYMVEPAEGFVQSQVEAIKKDFGPDSMNENLTPVCISKHGERWEEEQSDLGADEAYFRHPEPKLGPPALPEGLAPAPIAYPSNPVQLVNWVRQQGYKLDGYGVVELKERLTRPTTYQTLRAITALTQQLLISHNSGAHSKRIAFIDASEFEDLAFDFGYLIGTFAEAGFLVKRDNSLLSCTWAENAWDQFEPAPMPVRAPVDHSISNILMFLAQLGKKGIHLNPKGVTSETLYNMEKESKGSYPDSLYCKVLRGVYNEMIKGNTLYVVKCSIDEALGQMMEILRAVGLLSFSNIDRSEKPFCQVLTVNWELPKCSPTLA